MPSELNTALTGANALHEILRELGPEKPTLVDDRTHTFRGFLEIAFEHHSSVLLLIRTGANNASAWALLRILTETFYRGLWVIRCASDQDVLRIRTGGPEPYPPFREMTKQIDNMLGNSLGLVIGASEWSLMNGFTHSGYEQLARRYDSAGDLIPTYELKEMLLLVDLATHVLYMMDHFFCLHSHRPEDAAKITQSFKALSKPS